MVPSRAPSTDPRPSIARVDPHDVRINEVQALPQTIHQDPRGFLVETMRRPEWEASGYSFQMSYSSVTIPGQRRDADRWHVHKVQTDRFIVPLGEMTLALLDGREHSPTFNRLEVIRMRGAPVASPGSTPPRDTPTYLVMIPPGVLHCLANLSNQLLLLQNYPSELYDPRDEGRVLFVDRVIPALGRGFDWDLVDARSEP
jgi:dTDP-4-dehydrorhamnose 3,5-epimerase-like enzyme